MINVWMGVEMLGLYDRQLNITEKLKTTETLLEIYQLYHIV